LNLIAITNPSNLGLTAMPGSRDMGLAAQVTWVGAPSLDLAFPSRPKSLGSGIPARSWFLGCGRAKPKYDFISIFLIVIIFFFKFINNYINYINNNEKNNNSNNNF